MSKDTLKKERLQILNMLKDGIINAEEAAKLLEALEVSASTTLAPKKSRSFKMLKILIDAKDEEDGENVKMRVQIPVEFARLLKSQRFAGTDLSEYDIDVDALIEMVDSGALGEIVNIEADDATVKIVVE